MVIFTSCSEKNIEEMPANKTKVDVYVVNNMFAFQDSSHINRTIASFNKLSEKEKEEWYENYGIETYGHIFRKVIQQEDSISNYYFNLPEDKQMYFRSLPQVHSDQYKYALNKGVVKVVKTDDNEYFDINLIDRKYADFLNLDGKVIIGNNIISINECEEKVYFDAINCSSPIDLSKFENVTIRTSESLKKELKSGDPYNWSSTSTPRYYDKNFLGNYTKKTWAEIDGSSHLRIAFTDESSTCSRSVYCIFDLKSYAQKMNFWGNYVFTNWTPTVIFNGTWSYKHVSWDKDDDPLTP
jgi:hypothetical protein